jgi:hypothetical protein
MKSIKNISISLALFSSLYAGPSIHIDGGTQWTLLGSDQAIDLEKTFAGTPVKLVWGYDAESQDWVAYSPQYPIKDSLIGMYKMAEVLPPNSGFWVSSYEPADIELVKYISPYDNCLNVASPDFNSSEEINCSDYIARMPRFEVTWSRTELHEIENFAHVMVETSIAPVYIENIYGDPVPIQDALTPDANLSEYIQVVYNDGSIAQDVRLLESNGTISPWESKFEKVEYPQGYFSIAIYYSDMNETESINFRIGVEPDNMVDVNISNIYFY